MINSLLVLLSLGLLYVQGMKITVMNNGHWVEEIYELDDDKTFADLKKAIQEKTGISHWMQALSIHIKKQKISLFNAGLTQHQKSVEVY
jgi:hypothetical protein